MPKVTFLNEAITVDAKPGASIKELADAAGINLFEGFWATYHCKSRGLCLGSGCRVWVIEREQGAVSPRTFRERIRPTHRGAIRLACQARVQGDVEVRTQPGALEVEQNTRWDPDPAPSRWQDRTVGKSTGASKDDKDADGDAEDASG